ncbi:MAG: TonB-dependent receptor [Rhizomicrobium sp.]
MSKNRLRGSLLRSGAHVGTLCVALWTGQALAQAQTYAFDIPAEPLSTALREYARVSGQQIIFTDDLVAGKSAPALHGSYAADEALSHLLAGTALVIERSPTGAIMVRPKNAEAASNDGAANGSGVETVVVTGTNLRGVVNQTDPVLVLDHDQIVRSGYSSTEQLFESLPQNFSSAGSTQAGFLTGSNNFQFASGINLRGLGPSSTLVLLDGHRVAPAVEGSQVDVSAIPLAAIDHVEILTDGASAIYGSDAVGGVVNIITKSDYDGAETLLSGGAVTRGSRQEETIAQTIGGVWSGGSATGTVQYQNRTVLNTSDRSFSNGLPPPSDLLPEDQTYSAVVNARQEIGDNLQLYSDVLWSRRRFAEVFSNTEAPGAEDTEHNDGFSESLNLTGGARYAISPKWSLEANGLYSVENSTDLELQTGFYYPVPTAFSLQSRFVEESVDGLLNGSLGETGAGDISVALGASYRHEGPRYRIFENGAQVLLIEPDRDVGAVYGEMYLPIFGPQNARPLLQALNISAAVRMDHYSDFGSTTNPRVGVQWSPLGGLSFRGSYGTSFRAPTEAEATENLNPVAYISSFGDPNSAGTVPVLVGSVGSALTAERARTVDAGVDFQPSFVDGLSFSFNYYDIQYKDRIVQVSPPFNALQTPAIYGNLVTSLPDDAAAAAYLDTLVAAGASYLGDFTGTGMGTTGVRYAFNAGELNAALVHQSGLDLVTNYARNFDAGAFSAQINATYIDEIETAYTPGASSANLVDTFGNPPKWRVRGTATWDTAGWSINGAINFVGGYTNTAGLGLPPVSSWTTADFGARVHLDHYFPEDEVHGLTAALSVINAFDAAPPFVAASTQQTFFYDPANANPLGRFVSLEIRKTW